MHIAPTRSHAVTFGVLLFGMLCTAARALDWPIDYAVAHWVIDYRFGLIKRGLIGAALEPFVRHTPPQDVETIVRVLAGSVLVAYLLALAAVLLRILRAHAWDARGVLIAAMFATSNQVVMSGHLIGYYDQILYLAVLLSVLLCARRWYLAVGVLQALAVLAHENYVLIGLPLVALALWLATPRPSLSNLASALVLPLVALAVLAVHEALRADPDALIMRLALHLQRFPYISMHNVERVPGWLVRPVSDHLRTQIRWFLPRLVHPKLVGPALPFIAIASLLVFLPDLQQRRWRRLVPIAAAIGMPLLLLAVALDRSRIWAFAQMGCLIAIWIHVRSVRIAPQPLAGRALRGFGSAALATIALQVLRDCALLDLRQEHFAPWLRALLGLPVALLVLREIFADPRSGVGTLHAREPAPAQLSPSIHG